MRHRRRPRAPYRNQRFSWLHDRFGWFFNMSRKKQIALIAAIVAGVLLLIAIITTVVFAATLSSKESIMNRNKTGVTLLDRNGKEFFSFYDAHSDTYVTLDQIAPVAQQAVIAAEDKDFYNHPGFSIPGFLNAVVDNFTPGGSDGGGSTLTQQLVKKALLTSDRNFFRKYQELVLSIEIERQYSKQEILEMYLNSAYFGEGAFGIEDAAKTYFNKSAKDLTLAEASMLAGILPAPSAYSPITGDPESAKTRQDYVLGRMQDDKYVSEQEADAALAQELQYSAAQPDTNTKAPHFALMVKAELEEKYGEEVIARSGYKVSTTLNIDWQDKAQNAVATQVDRLASSSVSNGSLIAIDPKTGEVLALVGSKDWNNEQFGKVNMVTATRQPGSSFKPLVYGTGIEQRDFTAATIWEDKATDFGGYQPRNYDLSYHGNVTTRHALANSLNIPAVLAMQDTGIATVIDQAKKLGITTLTDSPDHYGLPLALGSGQARLSELTNAYATFANEGERNEVQTILRINDKNNKEIFKSTPKTSEAISAQTSFILSSILSDNGARSSTFGNSLTLWGGRPAAVKTGTTEDYRDALTIGYTPSLAVGVWIGNNDNSPMSAVAGASGSAPIWREFMQDALGDTPFEQFTQPSGIVSQQVCYGTGAIAQQSGTNTYPEFFRANALPTERCNAEQKPEPQEEVKEESKPETEKPEEETPTEEEPTDNPDETPSDNPDDDGTNPEEEDSDTDPDGPDTTPELPINP